MEEEKKKKTNIVKRDAAKKVKRTFDICSCEIGSGPHIHLLGAISIVPDNEEHKITMRVNEILVP